MLLPLRGETPVIWLPRALPWAGSLLAFQAVNFSFLNLSYSFLIIHYISSCAPRHQLPNLRSLMSMLFSLLPLRCSLK